MGHPAARFASLGGPFDFAQGKLRPPLRDFCRQLRTCSFVYGYAGTSTTRFAGVAR